MAATTQTNPPSNTENVADVEWALLKATNEKLQLENEDLRKNITWLKEQLKLINQNKFGKKSETSHALQLNLFDDLPAPDDTPADDEEKETVTYTRKKKKKGRNIDTSKLLREQVIHDLDDKTCQDCHSELKKIGEDKSEQIDYIPAQLKVIEHITPKYACKQCETIKSQPKPQGPIPKCMAGSGLLAEVIISKYENHIPLYRRSKMFERDKLLIPDNTLGNWVMGSAEALTPLRDALTQQINQAEYLQGDETPVKVLAEDKKAYMWCYHHPDPGNRFILYDYNLSREGEVVKTKLSQFKGILQTDGYSGYNTFRDEHSKVTNVGCFAHARRKFTDALKVAGQSEAGLATTAIKLIGQLYGIEERGKKLSTEKRLELRQKESVPILDEFEQFIISRRASVPPKSKLGKAFTYAFNQMPYLRRYARFGHVHIDNNLIENLIRPFALGRRNWLFVGNQRGGDASALLYSLIQTCRLNEINARAYLTYVLNQASAMRRGQIDATCLLPQFIDTTLLAS